MKITTHINEADLVRAVSADMVAQGLTLPVTNIKFIAGRGDNGMSAEVTLDTDANAVAEVVEAKTADVVSSAKPAKRAKSKSPAEIRAELPIEEKTEVPGTVEQDLTLVDTTPLEIQAAAQPAATNSLFAN